MQENVQEEKPPERTHRKCQPRPDCWPADIPIVRPDKEIEGEDGQMILELTLEMMHRLVISYVEKALVLLQYIYT